MSALARPRLAGAIGAALLLPALLFIVANVLKHELGFPVLYDSLDGLIARLDSPVILLGGLFGALGLNALALAGVAWRQEGDAWSATITLRPRAFNLAVAGAALTLLGTIFLYVLAENCGPR